MSFNGAGLYQRLFNWVADKNNGIPITASRMDGDSNDFAAAFNLCLTRDGQGSPIGNIPFNNFRAFNLGDATSLQDAMNARSVQNNTAEYAGLATGTANAIAITCPIAPVAYVPGQMFMFKAAATNTGPTTINVNSLGAKPLLINGAACVGGEVQNGATVMIFYDGTNQNIVATTLAGPLTIGSAGPTITSGSAVPASTQPQGSLYLRTGGAVGSTLYVSQGGGTWNAVAGV